MYCPKCKKEYREGFFQCTECIVDLAYGQPPEEGCNDFVEVFSTYQQSDIAFIKSVLDGEDIHYFFQGENSAMLVGAGAYARLLVRIDEVPGAKEILQDLGFLGKSRV